MKLLIIILFIAFSFNQIIASDKPAYKIFDSDGVKVSYETILEGVKDADVVMFGELHNNPICHWLQYELTKDLHELKKNALILGAEMFEADDQVIVDEYLKGQITEKNFKKESKVWPNFETDYKPLLDYAKTNHLKFVATNIPRRYASLIHSRGIKALDSLEKEAYKWIVPLPFTIDLELKCYKDIMKNTMGHGGKNLPKAQAVKDATMSYFILKNFKPGDLFLHFNGAYHSDNYESIVWYLKQDNPDLNIATISAVEQANVDKLNEESFGLADFIICIPESMTKTY
jgi:uncharacterized iron-regulated protein